MYCGSHHKIHFCCSFVGAVPLRMPSRGVLNHPWLFDFFFHTEKIIRTNIVMAEGLTFFVHIHCGRKISLNPWKLGSNGHILEKKIPVLFFGIESGGFYFHQDSSLRQYRLIDTIVFSLWQILGELGCFEYSKPRLNKIFFIAVKTKFLFILQKQSCTLLLYNSASGNVHIVRAVTGLIPQVENSIKMTTLNFMGYDLNKLLWIFVDSWMW